MIGNELRFGWLAALCLSLVQGSVVALAQGARPTSYAPVVLHESFESLMARMSQAKPEAMKRQMDLLNARYDLSNTPAQGVTMSGGKPVREGRRNVFPRG